MKHLEENHAEVYQHMCEGGFIVRRSNRYRFNYVSTDQALEQPLNKEGKSEGGIIGLALWKGAMIRWLMTRHIASEFANAFQVLCHDESQRQRMHEGLWKSRKTGDESDVQKVVGIITGNRNPFDIKTVPSKLVYINTGQVASPEVANSLTGFLDVGRQKHVEFMERRPAEGTKSLKFWDAEK